MSDASDGGPLSIHAAQAAYPTKAYGVLAAMVNFKDDTRTPYTPTQINDALGVSQVNYWLNSAYSVAFNRTNKIAGWYTLPINKTCDVYQISTEANKVLMSKGINPNSFDRVIYLFPSQCPWGGKGEMPGKLAWITNNTFINYAMAHEEGHNFGINHANSYTCGTKQIDIPANCTEKEYGEYSSAMGTGDFNAYYFNAAHTTMLNWWNATNNVKVISTGGIYTMNNYLFGETFDTKVRGAKIRKPNTNEYYYLSYRWRDAQYPVADLPAGIKQGLNIVISNDVISRQTKALDMSPGDGDMRNASLKDGQTFTDATNKITIKQISRKFEANDASVTFEVKFN